MKKQLLQERFQKLAGIKPLYSINNLNENENHKELVKQARDYYIKKLGQKLGVIRSYADGSAYTHKKGQEIFSNKEKAIKYLEDVLKNIDSKKPRNKPYIEAAQSIIDTIKDQIKYFYSRHPERVKEIRDYLIKKLAKEKKRNDKFDEIKFLEQWISDQSPKRSPSVGKLTGELEDKTEAVQSLIDDYKNKSK